MQISFLPDSFESWSAIFRLVKRRLPAVAVMTMRSSLIKFPPSIASLSVVEERRVENEVDPNGPVERIVGSVDHVIDADFSDQVPQAFQKSSSM
jgi:hypothetical protein